MRSLFIYAFLMKPSCHNLLFWKRKCGK